MRGELSRKELSLEFSRVLAAVNIAQDIPTARSLLKSYISSPDARIASVARVQMAWALLRSRDMRGGVFSEIRELLPPDVSSPHGADSAYIRAVLFFEENRHDLAEVEITQALAINPNYWNARVLSSLIQIKRLRSISGDASFCAFRINALIEIMAPLLELGACPVHVAHFDLAVTRYLGEPSGGAGRELAHIRKILLSYVARNNQLGANLVKTYSRETSAKKQCFADVTKLINSGKP
jgi:hypothetical protein